MMASGGAKVWFTAQELATLSLPGLPKTKRKINELAAEQGWAFKTDPAGIALARPRTGRGGGLEYHLALLPPISAAELARKAPQRIAATETGGKLQRVAAVSATQDREQLWTWFDQQPDSAKADAANRLAAIDAVEIVEAGGSTRTAAVAVVAGARGVSAPTLWNWLGATTGARRDDRLPLLAPRRRGGGAEATLHPLAWQAFKSDFLRAEKPTLAACYARLQVMAAGQGWGELPHVKTLQRRIEKELDPRVVILAREGADKLRRSLPPQSRSVAQLHALEHVNIDGHRWDVFVRWPATAQHPKGLIARPMMVAIQDLYSRKILAWRIGPSESADMVRLAFADLFRTWGVPDACTLDNGRGFASKWITGGAPNRFRFKVQPSDPTGLLTQLSVQIHWTLPYRGQSKPIERAFRDLCEYGAKHPAFAGAYTGNKPDAKPDNYGSKAVPLEDFRTVIDAVIAAHNARPGRRTEMARGEASFDQVFADSYAASPIRRATEEQLRMALLGADRVTTDRQSGALRLFETSYWDEALAEHAGSPVVVRFDPDDLRRPVHVYDLVGRFLCTAAVWGETQFIDANAAKERARLESNSRKAARAALEAEALLTQAELAGYLEQEPEDDVPASPNIIRPVRVRGATAAALKPVDQVEDAAPARRALIDRLPDLSETFERPALRLVETEPGAGMEAPRPERGA